MAEECSVKPNGRIFGEDGKLCGLVMPYETPLVEPSPNYFEASTVSPSISPATRAALIQQLCALVKRLHLKGVIHGDIKPSNLLQCSDGELRFCDFGCAVLASRDAKPLGSTTRYASPRQNSSSLSPISIADDLYATGVTIWEIYTGLIPFRDIDDEEMLEDVIAAGVRPDTSHIHDAEIANLIYWYLEQGDPLGGVIRQAEATCITADVSYNCCVTVPPHFYLKLVHSISCSDKGSTEKCFWSYRAMGISKPAEDDSGGCPDCQGMPDHQTSRIQDDSTRI